MSEEGKTSARSSLPLLQPSFYATPVATTPPLKASAGNGGKRRGRKGYPFFLSPLPIAREGEEGSQFHHCPFKSGAFCAVWEEWEGGKEAGAKSACHMGESWGEAKGPKGTHGGIGPA